MFINRWCGALQLRRGCWVVIVMLGAAANAVEQVPADDANRDALDDEFLEFLGSFDAEDGSWMESLEFIDIEMDDVGSATNE